MHIHKFVVAMTWALLLAACRSASAAWVLCGLNPHPQGDELQGALSFVYA